jgi:hypothetical protein
LAGQLGDFAVAQQSAEHLQRLANNAGDGFGKIDGELSVVCVYSVRACAVGDDGRNQRGDRVFSVRHLFIERAQLFGETAQVVDFQQEPFWPAGRKPAGSWSFYFP